LEKAEPLIRRALAIDEAAYGPNHPNVAIRLNNLAQLLQDTDRLEEAEPLMRRVLAIDEAAYGPNHLSVAVGLSNLALLLHDTNRSVEAKPLMRRHLAIIMRFQLATGHEHPRWRTAVNNYGGLLEAMGKTEEEALASIVALQREVREQWERKQVEGMKEQGEEGE